MIAEGEVMQLSAAKNTATTEDEYLAVIRAKTAALFAAACEVGPIMAGGAKAEQAACRSYGTNLGIAFQLVDDALDYGGASAKLGKNVGDDFREGKITLPVVLSFRRGSEEERGFWRRTLEIGHVHDGDVETRSGHHAPPHGSGGHGRAGPPLRRHGRGRARYFPGKRDETGTRSRRSISASPARIERSALTPCRSTPAAPARAASGWPGRGRPPRANKGKGRGSAS